MSGVKCEAIAGTEQVQLGEGPHWAKAEQALYFVDLLKGVLHRVDGATQRHASVKPGKGRELSLVVPVLGHSGHFVVGHGRDLALLAWDGGATCKLGKTLVTVDDALQARAETRFNDGKADLAGRLWAGTMHTGVDKGQPQKKVGTLYSLEEFGARAEVREQDLEISNGLAWASDTFYFIDSPTRRVDAYDYSPANGAICNRRTVFDFNAHGVEGLPDGMTIDTKGNLWVACFGGSQVVCVDPVEGKLLKTVSIPAPQVTSVAFGGPGLDELYVTTAAINLSAADKSLFPQAGSLFRVTGLGATGLPANDVVISPKIIGDF